MKTLEERLKQKNIFPRTKTVPFAAPLFFLLACRAPYSSKDSGSSNDTGVVDSGTNGSDSGTDSGTNEYSGNTYYDDPADAEDFGFGNGTWGSTNLTYAFDNYSDSDKIDSYRDTESAIASAFGIWSAACTTFTFEQIQDASADIIIGWYEGEHGDGEPFDGAGDGINNVLAHAWPPNNSLDGDTHFDDYERWVIDENPTEIYGEIDVVTVAAHEFGHALGLEHSTDSDSLMYTSYTGAHRYITSDDLDAIAELYTCETNCDVDEDGHLSETCAGDDCNDNNDDIHPEVTENCNTSYDDNCNGETNEEDSIDCVDYYYDKDEDGYGKDQSMCLCVEDGYYSSLVSGDCEDTDASISPSSLEDCVDSIDNDCNDLIDCDDAAACSEELECLTPVTLTLPVTEDTYISEENESTNYDGSNLATEDYQIGYDEYFVSTLLDFNLTSELSAYPSSTYSLTSATLYLYVKSLENVSTFDVQVSPINDSWNESTVTWDTGEPIYGISVRSGSGQVEDTISGTGLFTFDVTNPAGKVHTGAYSPDYGFCISSYQEPTSSTVEGITAYSKEVYSSRAAYLVVELDPL